MTTTTSTGRAAVPPRRRTRFLTLAAATSLVVGTLTSTAGAASAAAPSRPPTAAAVSAQPGGQLETGVVLHVGVSLYSPGRTFRLVVSDYGDLLLLDAANAVVWHTQTSGERDASLVVLDDGDLVLRSNGGRKLWSSGTNGYAPSALTVTDDGRAVLTASSGVSWTSAGLVSRPAGGVSQVDPVAAAAGAWALRQSFSGAAGACNPYSFAVGTRSVACPTGQARPSAQTRRNWNTDFAGAAWKRNGAAATGLSNVIHFQDVAAMHPAGSGYTPEPGDVAVFYDGHDDSQGRVGVVTQVNRSTRMVRLAIGDVRGAVLHLWLPMRGSSFAGEPLHAYAHPLPA